MSVLVVGLSHRSAPVEVLEQSRSRGATACFDKVSFLPRLPALLERYGTTAA